MNIDDISRLKGVLGVGEFDQLGNLVSYRSSILDPVQADSTARLSGVLFSLITNILSLYSKFCGVPMDHADEILFHSQDLTMILMSGSKRSAGVIFRNSDLKTDEIRQYLGEYCGDR
ncbi:MAG: hypothetical protein OWQ34_04335 [Thermoplasma acidophilum]|nr:hypothetical protein [Thermoplasma acidophilum]